MAKRKFIPTRPPLEADHYRNQPGPAGVMWRMVYGDDDRHFGEICEAEATAAQLANPTRFTEKAP